MIEVTGKYNTAKIYSDNVEANSLAQVETLCNQPFAEGSRIRLMPDIHAGLGCTVGTTMTVGDKIVPNIVGVDIGCGMYCARLEEKRIDLPKFDSMLRKLVPSGFNVRTEKHRFVSESRLDALRCARHVNRRRARMSLGTLGGGNHFIEIGRDDDGGLYLTIHSGSRHLGLEVAQFYQNYAFLMLNLTDEERTALETAQASGRDDVFEKLIKNRRRKQISDVPYALSYLEGRGFDDYLHDMAIVQEFAQSNRNAMADVLIKALHLHASDAFTTVHNYIDIESMILRKGAVSAKSGERLLIPINMRDGSLLCTGRGNPDWNASAPHGAGRLFSRKDTRERFTVSEFKAAMDGVFSTSVDKNTLDECPMAYKSMDEIARNIEDTVRIDKIVRPIYNFKAGGEETN